MICFYRTTSAYVCHCGCRMLQSSYWRLNALHKHAEGKVTPEIFISNLKCALWVQLFILILEPLYRKSVITLKHLLICLKLVCSDDFPDLSVNSNTDLNATLHLTTPNSKQKRLKIDITVSDGEGTWQQKSDIFEEAIPKIKTEVILNLHLSGQQKRMLEWCCVCWLCQVCNFPGISFNK